MATQFPFAVERYRKALEKIHSWVPIDFLLSWILKESGGDLKSITPLGERGLFQVHPGDEQAFLGLSNSDFQRLSTDLQFSLETGVHQALAYAKQAKKILKDAGTEWHGGDFWKLVKLHHNAFAIPTYALKAYVAANGAPPADWDTLQTFALDATTNKTDLVPDQKAFSARLRTLIPKTFANADVVGRVVPSYSANEVALATNAFKRHGVVG